MKTHLLLTACGGAALLIATGCSSKVDAQSDLAKPAAAMTEPATPAPAAKSAAQPVAAPVQSESVAAASSPSAEMNQALAAYKGGQLDDAVTRLQKLRATSALTPQQRIALNDAMASVMTEIYALAAKGDARAIQAARQYEKLQTQRH